MSASHAQVKGNAPLLRGFLEAAHDRPLLLGPSLEDFLVVEHASDEDPAHAIAWALRRSGDAIVAAQRSIAELGAELLVAPTSNTTAPALHATGQAYRAAALTAAAVDFTRDAVLASGARAAVLGAVPARAGSRERAEAATHVERLATSAVDGILVLAHDLVAAREVVAAAASHCLPVVVEIEERRSADAARALAGTSCAALVVRGGDPDALLRAVEAVRTVSGDARIGARFFAPERDAQLAVAAAFSVLSSAALAILGVGGPGARSALPALVDLSRAPRASIPT